MPSGVTAAGGGCPARAIVHRRVTGSYTVYRQVVPMPPAESASGSALLSSAASRSTRSSRWVSSSSAGRSTSARVRTAIRSRPMVAEARMPWPTTSPTTSPTRAPDSGITSNQSPPTPARVAAGRYRVAISSASWSGQRVRQQAALQGHGGGAGPRVAARLLDAGRRLGAELLGEPQLLRPERPPLRVPAEQGHAERAARGEQRHRQQRAGPGRAQPGGARVQRRPLGDRRVRRVEQLGAGHGQAAGGRRVGRADDRFADPGAAAGPVAVRGPRAGRPGAVRPGPAGGCGPPCRSAGESSRSTAMTSASRGTVTSPSS